MGFFKLGALHYSFSRSQLHHRKGYPLWVFVAMTTIGIIVIVSAVILFTLVHTLPSHCGYTADDRFYWEYMERSVVLDGDSRSEEQFILIFHLWHFTVSTVGQIWDISILFLYFFKIYSFRKLYGRKDDGVFSKLLFILYRIVIVTVFYQLTSLILAILYNVLDYVPWPSLMEWPMHFVRNQLFPAMFSILISFCMFLMMEHNTDSYVAFLQCIRVSRLDTLCFCCCRRIVHQQLSEYEGPALTEIQMVNTVSSGDLKKNPSMNTETKSAIYKTGRGYAASLDTVTEVDVHRNSGPLRPSICPISEESAVEDDGVQI